MGPYISMRTYAYIAIGINIIFLSSFIMMPDSPYRYISEGNIEKAESSLKWFRRSNNIKNELLELQDYVSNSKATFKQRINELKQSRKYLFILIRLFFNFYIKIDIFLYMSLNL